MWIDAKTATRNDERYGVSSCLLSALAPPLTEEEHHCGFKAFYVATLLTSAISRWFQLQLQTKDNFILLLSFGGTRRNKDRYMYFYISR